MNHGVLDYVLSTPDLVMLSRRLFFCALVWSLSFSAWAQVYTWTDENGKVHYSDQRRVSHAEAKVIDVGGMPPAPFIDHQTPASYSGEVFPLVLDRFYYADAVSDESKALITYYFGGDCVSPTSENFNQLRVRYPKVLRDDANLQAATYRQLRKSSYGLLYRAGHYSMPVVDGAEIRVLNAEIIDLKINACRTNLHAGATLGDLESAAVSSFDVLNAWIEVKWQLADSPNSEAISSWVTQGVAATRLDRDLSLFSAVEDAYLVALDQLQNNENWREAIHNPEEARHLIKSNSVPEPSTVEALYKQKVQFAQALVELSPLQAMIAEYYQVRGVMPLSISALGVRRQSMKSAVVDNIAIAKPGTLRADLAGTNEGVFIEWVPELEHGYTGIKWRCLSNAADAVLPDACEVY